MERITPGMLTVRAADELNNFIERAEMFMGLSVVAPLLLSSATGRPVLKAPGSAQPIKITGKIRLRTLGEGDVDPLPIPDCAYSWIAIRPDLSSCTPEEMEGVAGGFIDQIPAISLSGDTGVSTGSEVLAFLSPSQEYLIFGGGGGCSNESGNGGCIQIVTDVTCDVDLGYKVNKYNFWFPKCLGIKVWKDVDTAEDNKCIACSNADGNTQTEVYGVITDAGTDPPSTYVYDPPDPADCV